jgi:LysR family glycine cleavage system transcriptional activator
MPATIASSARSLGIALAGQGVALAARSMGAPSLAAGTLVAPFPVAIRAPYTYWLVARDDVVRRPAAQDTALSP